MWSRPQLGLESEDKEQSVLVTQDSKGSIGLESEDKEQSVLVTQDSKGSTGLESEDTEQSILVTQDSKGSTTAGSHTAASYFQSPRSVTRHQSLCIIVSQIQSTVTQIQNTLILGISWN